MVRAACCFLTGDGSHAQLPASALSGEDALAVVGWLYLPTRASGPVFDFGHSPATRLFAFVDAQGFRATAVVDGQVRGETEAKPVVENQRELRTPFGLPARVVQVAPAR